MSNSPVQLARDFAPTAAAARSAVRVFYDVIAADRPREFATVNLAEIRPAAARLLGQAYRLPEADGPTLLLAVQTYYAALVRLMVRQWSRAAEPLLGDTPYDWPAAVGDERLTAVLGSLAARMALCRPPRGEIAEVDRLAALYQAVFPRRVRHALGEYYTPGWLAEHVLDEAGFDGQPDRRLLDPTCGSGTFLVAAIGRIRRRAADLAPRELARAIVEHVAGFDIHPLAVLSARANYLLALGEFAESLPCDELPIYQRDAILDETPPGGLSAAPFDYVVGNPPWIAWDNLPQSYREATDAHWRRYGLFTLSAAAARHGGAKKDLAMLVIYAAADRYLADGGRLAMVVPQTVFQTKGAGDGFRRFRLGDDGPWLRVIRAGDLTDLRPFDAANWTGTLVLEKGSPTIYPVPYVRWSPGDGAEGGRPVRLVRRECLAAPVDAARLSSPWIVRPAGETLDLARLVGPSDYTAHLGANSGGANGVYWMEIVGRTADGLAVRNLPGRGKSVVPLVETVLEADHLYPLLRWGDVARWHARSSAHILLVQDTATRRGIDELHLKASCPRTYAYLERFRPLLVSRAAYRRYQKEGAFYSMYNVGPYTLAPVKVVWRRMDRRIRAAVVGAELDPLLGCRAVVPQETCVTIAADSLDEAHYVCAMVNSVVAGAIVAAHSVRGGKGFGTPSVLGYLGLRRFQPGDPLHADLAAASRAAHVAAAAGADLAACEAEVDRLAAEAWSLTPDELGTLRREMAADGTR